MARCLQARGVDHHGDGHPCGGKGEEEDPGVCTCSMILPKQGPLSTIRDPAYLALLLPAHLLFLVPTNAGGG